VNPKKYRKTRRTQSTIISNARVDSISSSEGPKFLLCGGQSVEQNKNQMAEEYQKILMGEKSAPFVNDYPADFNIEDLNQEMKLMAKELKNEPLTIKKNDSLEIMDESLPLMVNSPPLAKRHHSQLG